MADPLLEQLGVEAPPEAVAPVAPSLEEQQMGGLLGQAATAAFGVGRTATFGLSDALLAEGANIFGGESARKDMLRGLNVAKQVNPYTNMAGELAGLFVGGGTGVTRLGEAAEGAIAGRLGEGLLGSAASMAGRGAVEGAMLGATASISEDTLGDHDVNAEKLFAHAAKDALIGGVAGGALGAAGFGLKRAFSGLLGEAGAEATGAGEALARTKGPTPNAVLDEVAGVEGGGKAVLSEAEALQASVGELRSAGATSEQATRLVDEVGDLAKARIAGGEVVGGKVDDVAEQFIRQRAGGDPEMADALRKVYVDRAAGLRTYEAGIEGSSLKMADAGTRVMRGIEDTANEVQFTYKAEQMLRKVDASKLDAQADAFASMLQDVDGTLAGLEGTFSKGGMELGVNKLRRTFKDTLAKAADIGTDASPAMREQAARDLFIAADNLKRAVGKQAQFGKEVFVKPEAAREFADLYERLRVGLEDANVWGDAGLAQQRWNKSFSDMFPRRKEFGRRFSVSIDEVSGTPRPELDPSKIKSTLRSLDSEADSKVAKDTIEAVIAGQRDRAAAILEYGNLTPKQAEKIQQGLRDLDEFERAWLDAQKEARVANKIRSMQLEERDKALGGLIGLGADLMQRPLTSVERLAAVRATASKTENAIKNGLEKFFAGEKGSAVLDRLAPAAKAASKETVAEQISAVRDVSTNQPALAEKVKKLVGDLGEYAPKTAVGVQAVATRAVTYLAAEAPTPRVGVTLGSSIGKPRYSDAQLDAWAKKRDAVMNPASVVDELRQGKLNREGIRAVETVYPKLFAEMQGMAQEYIAKLAAQGKLESMPREQQAAIASLLKVPPNETWRPDFLLLMQGAKAVPSQQQTPQTGPAPVAKRPIKVNTALYETEAQQIEGRTT